MNRPSIVWLAARRQGKTRPAAREFHLDDARFAGKTDGPLRIHAGSVAAGWLRMARNVRNDSLAEQPFGKTVARILLLSEGSL